MNRKGNNMGIIRRLPTIYREWSFLTLCSRNIIAFDILVNRSRVQNKIISARWLFGPHLPTRSIYLISSGYTVDETLLKKHIQLESWIDIKPRVCMSLSVIYDTIHTKNDIMFNFVVQALGNISKRRWCRVSFGKF